ncbi:Tetratricopeptide repeat-domain-containing protein [Pyronema domesticum]|nr:Tetratricopeptide repeat-domain-containing protein [Pyronema domesticum]
MANLASVYKMNGRFNEAEKMGSKALEIYERLLGKNHVKTADSMSRLGMVYLAQGRLKEAEELIVEAVEILKRVGCEDHYRLLWAMSNLAETLHSGSLGGGKGTHVECICADKKCSRRKSPRDTRDSTDFSSVDSGDKLIMMLI